MSKIARRHVGAAVAGIGLLVAGCGGTSSNSAASPTTAALSPPTTLPAVRTLTVFLPGSLSDAFTLLGTRFEADNPGVTVKFNATAPASDLAQQIVGGAMADVFASAGDAAMKAVTDALKADGSPLVLATNALEIAAAPGNPKGITSFADLAKPDVKVAVCEPKATACGQAAVKVEQAAGVTLKPVGEESSLKAVLSDVTTGKADAGLVYATDVVSAKNTVQGIMFPESSKATTNYPIAVVKGAAQPELAKKFVEFVTGPTGRTTLKAAGFSTP